MNFDVAWTWSLLAMLLGGSTRAQAPSCTPRAGIGSPGILAESPVAAKLSGHYAVTVIAGDQETDDTIVQGTLELRPRQSAAPRRYWGWTDIDFTRFGPSSQLYSPGSKDPQHPGVFSLIDRPSGRLNLVVGGLANDRGLILTVLTGDSARFFGTWTDGGLRIKRIHGYFCATRDRKGN